MTYECVAEPTSSFHSINLPLFSFSAPTRDTTTTKKTREVRSIHYSTLCVQKDSERFCSITFHRELCYTAMKLICFSAFVAAASAFSPASVSSSVSRAAGPSTQLYGEFGASSTSFYTTAEKQDTYASLEDTLNNKCKDPKVRQVIVDMLDVCADITDALRTALVTVEGSMNDFGDAQLSVDVSVGRIFCMERLVLFFR